MKRFLKAFAGLHHKVAADFALERGLGPQAGTLSYFLLSRLLVLYFIQKRGWLNGEQDYLYSRFDHRHRGDPAGHSYYSEVLLPLLGCRLFEDGGAGLLSARLKVKNSTLERAFEDLLERFSFTAAEDAPLGQTSAIDPEVLGKIFEGLILQPDEAPGKGVRKLTGSYYTPRDIVRFMCRESLKEYLSSRLGEETAAARKKVAALFSMPPAGPLDDEAAKHLRELFTAGEAARLRRAALDCRACDPAVGSGAFLVGMLHEMALAVAKLDVIISGPDAVKRRNYDYNSKKQIIESCLYGVDLQEEAARLCWLRLWLSLAADYEAEAGEQVGFALVNALRLPALSRHLLRGDSLESSRGKRAEGNSAFTWRADFAEVFAERDGFDIIIGNPPYVNMVEMESRPEVWDRASLRESYQSARGGFDLYIPFYELSLRIVRPGGVVSLITPNKLLSAQYASSLRQKIAKEATVLGLTDLARSKAFGAAVYPVAALIKKSRSPRSIQVFKGERRGGSIAIEQTTELAPGSLDRLPHSNWSVLIHPGLELLLPVLSLGQTFASVCAVKGAATVAEAYEIKGMLKEGPAAAKTGRLLVSGNIDRYRNTWGSRRTQYIKSRYLRPVLPENGSALSEVRRKQMRSPKVIISGMARRPKAYLDCDGRYAAAKSTVILYDPKVSLAFLCGLLNSSLYMMLYDALFGALSLGGGYMRFGPPQISRLPLTVPAARKVDLIAEAVERLQEAIASERLVEARGLDALINKEALEIYGIDHDDFSKVFLEVFGSEPDDYQYELGGQN